MTEGASDPISKAPVPLDPIGGALKSIAKRHEELQEQETLSLFVPGYEGMMQVTYKLLPPAEMDRRAEMRNQMKGKGITGEWEVEAQTINDLCESILVRDPESDKYIVLKDENGPIRFESRFADVMAEAGVKVSGARAREIVLDFFCPRVRQDDPSSPRLLPNAMDRHCVAIMLWYSGRREQIERTLLGE